MKLNEKDVDIESTESFESIDFSLDMESLGVLMKGFSDNLYSNKIGSIVREIASNCFDAHAEVNNPEPVKIVIRETQGTHEIAFIDYGPGLSPERIKTIYSKYFSSSKRGTNNEIGGFGIGAKSPFSYTDSFLVKTYVDGIEYHYIMHRGVTVPEIKLIFKNECECKNGTEVIIPIKNTSDLDKFKKELKEQLKYFDNIDYENCGISNDYSLLRVGPVIIREELRIDQEGSLEVCIGKVRYPLNTSEFPWETKSLMNSVNARLALMFDIGEISVTMTRESIEYTPEVIAKITERYSEAIEFFTKQYGIYLDKGSIYISSYLSSIKSSSPRLPINTPTGVFTIPLKGLYDPAKLSGTYKPLSPYPFLDLKGALIESVIRFSEYYEGTFVDICNFSRRNRFSKTTRVAQLPRGYRTSDLVQRISMIHAQASGIPPIYRKKESTGSVNAMKISYIHEEEGDDLVTMIILRDFDEGYKLFLKDCIKNNTSEPDEVLRAAYKTLRSLVINEIKMMPKTTSYEEIVVPEKFKADWKASRSKSGGKTAFDPTTEVMLRLPFVYLTSARTAVRWTKKPVQFSELLRLDKKGVVLVLATQAQVELAAEAAMIVMANMPGSLFNQWRSSTFELNLAKPGQVILVKVAEQAKKKMLEVLNNAVDLDYFVTTKQFRKWGVRFHIGLDGSRLMSDAFAAKKIWAKQLDTKSDLAHLRVSPHYSFVRVAKQALGLGQLQTRPDLYINWGVSVHGKAVSFKEFQDIEAKWEEITDGCDFSNFADTEEKTYAGLKLMMLRGHLPPDIPFYLKLRERYKAGLWKKYQKNTDQSVSAQEDQSA
jgi:anti-sigma regulatory factor (Ser/Thr protein kinase)